MKFDIRAFIFWGSWIGMNFLIQYLSGERLTNPAFRVIVVVVLATCSTVLFFWLLGFIADRPGGSSQSH